MGEELPSFENYSLIRQPYRITMSMWNYSVWQKRILTKIIARLQRDITLLERGVEFGQLELFKSSNDDTVRLKFLLSDFIKDGNNYAQFKKAINQLRSVNVEIVQIILPAIKSKKAKKPEEEVVLTGLIERAVIKKYARDITISMHKATAMELMKVANGLTVFAEDVMYETNNKYTQKIYEIICQWKDVGVYTLSIEKFRELLVLKNKYADTKILIRDIICPVEKELKKIGDIFFDFSVSKRGNVITHFNFIIKTKALLKEESEHLLLVKEDTINLLRQHFGFKVHHLEQIEWILKDLSNIATLRSKITELALKLADRKLSGQPIKDIPAWSIASIRNEFYDKEI
ncbi:MAG TPA: replication initiation protein [Hanamia sp.]|nr:replication initiation protein [Hanamia sp.]